MLAAILFMASRIQAPVDTLVVDAREAERSLFHVTETLHVKPGGLALSYPKWIPGEHSPSGPLNSVFNFYVEANGKPLAWQRDPVELNTVRLTVPEGVDTVSVRFDQSSAAAGQFGKTGSNMLSRLKWNRLVWYPFQPSDEVRFQPSVILPEGWSIATSLNEQSRSGQTVVYAPDTLTRIVDSPAQIGRFYHSYDVSGVDPTKYSLEVMADTQEAVDAAGKDAAFLKGMAKLHEEATAMTGSHHYDKYKWLLTLSDEGAFDGLEHHESSEDGMGETAVTSPAQKYFLADLLSHEYFHSFNGKFRRPVGLCTPEYQTPMQDELLWVYEGMTQFYGQVLPVRAGFWTEEQFRDQLAANYESLRVMEGRNWRPLSDTAVAAPTLYSAPDVWLAARRSTDFYDEMTLVWLEVDQKIRDVTKGAKSLNDFSRVFHGGPANGVELKPYTFDDVVGTLNSVAPYDWAGLLRQRIYSIQPQPTTAGIEASGWHVVYSDVPNVVIQFADEREKSINLMGSLGLYVKEGAIGDVVPGSPADKAGLAPGMKLIALNGRKFDADLLKQAVLATPTTKGLDLTVENQQFQKTVHLAWDGGLHQPHLERVKGVPDRLHDLLRALSAP